MHLGQIEFRSYNRLIKLGLVAIAFSPSASQADEPGLFGRLFRGGSTPSPAKTNTSQAAVPNLSYGRSASSLPLGDSRFDGPPPSRTVSTSNAASPDFVSTPQPEISNEQGAMPKLMPKSRVNRPITNAEPILTRFALGRSNDGSQFGMFLEVFADGTVLDSEGVHHVRPADLQPVVEAIQGSDFSKIRGHSGAPPTDFIDNVQIIVFDRRLGRLTAHPFSYSGNPQGADHAIRNLHSALEGLQLKLSKPNQPVVGSAGIGSANLPNPDSGMATASPGPSNSSSAKDGQLNPKTGPGLSDSVPAGMPPLPNPSAGATNPPSNRAPAGPFSQRVSSR